MSTSMTVDGPEPEHEDERWRSAQERVRASRRSGDLDDLWPEVPTPWRRAAAKKIEDVVVGILAGDERRIRLEASDEQEVRAIGVAAFVGGMGPLLGHWIQEGRVEAPEPLRSLLGEHLEHGERRAAMLRGHAARVARAMKEVGVAPILLKGIHLGGEFFPRPGTRTATDVDFLVRPHELSKACAVMASLGFTETLSSAFQRRSTWVHPTTSREVRSIELDRVDNPWSVDVHVALERWYFRGTRRDLGDDAFETTRSIDLEGERVHVLDQPHLVAFLALHTSAHFRQMQLVRLVELVWVIRRDRAAGRLDFDELGELLDRTRTGRFVYPALALADELAPGTVDASLLARLGRAVSPRMRRVLDKIRREHLGPLNERSSDVLLAWAVGPRELALNALEIGWQSDDAVGGPLHVLGRRLGMVGRRIARRVAPGPRAVAGAPSDRTPE